MSAVVHLPHHLFYNVLLAVTVIVLLWLLIYVIGAELGHRMPVEMIAPL